MPTSHSHAENVRERATGAVCGVAGYEKSYST
jgi:hypothetical protein